MGMVVQHNMNAINSYNKLNANVAGMKKSSEKLSSGYRINRAGDDAAGLAVSEKMRSQIKGLNQAIRNSQDGINMIQTFEGAAQESHSILQRMKELASQSANGTYDDPTDRAAIQLEFNQLNDELNQIADTDFNGTIVLNGGVMSDGLEAVDNKFDYANKQGQVIAKAQASASEALEAAKKTFEAAKKEFESVGYDLSENGTAPEWNTVDNNSYNKTKADAVWVALGITKDGAPTAADTSKCTEISVTYEFDGSAWSVSKATGNDKADYTAAAQANLTATPATVTDANGKGGFNVAVADANAIFEATKAKKGDTVTLVLTNTDPSKLAPTNVGFKANSVEVVSNGTTTIAAPAASLTTSAVKDTEMTPEHKAIYDKLDGTEIEATYTTGAIAITIGGQTVTAGGANIDVDGVTMYAKYATGTLTISTKDGADDLMTITLTDKDTNAIGTAKGTIALDTALYGDGGAITVKAGDDKDLGTSIQAGESLAKAQAELDAVQAKYDAITDYESAKAYLDEKGVSISDSFDNSTARLTYAENITLQTGARSKDSVNFTFNYNNDKSADMGTLEATLNISARKEGLNTEGLSLATQEDANHAIDQIDKAINKVSMVRASFGSIQNRLEHKITNLTTTSENLTEAESAIRDTDMASEMMNYTKFNILQQAAQSMLAQANQQPQSILQLLG